MSLRSKCDRAVVAYLKSVGVAPNIYPANYSGARTLPCVTVHTHDGRPEEQFTGNYRFQLRLRCEAEAAQQPDVTNADANRVALDAIVVAVHDAMMQTMDNQGLGETSRLISAFGRDLAGVADPVAAANDADMAEFTAQALYESGLDGGSPKMADGTADSNFFIEDVLFEVVCCGKNVD